MSKNVVHFFFGLIVAAKLFDSVNPGTHPEDVKVLRDLKAGIDPKSMVPGSCLSSWDFSVDPCDNAFGDKFTCGFRCHRAPLGLHRVSEIALDQVGYSGNLSSVSWNLRYLQTLEIPDNAFYGPIPESFSSLPALRRLSLSRNMLSGELPASLAALAHLEELYLDDNRFDGRVPSNFCFLASIKRLEIQGNRLSGRFPDLSALENLYFLDASSNRLSGPLPGTLPLSLVELSMRSNSLEGTLPHNLNNLKLLQVLDLSHNKLSGPIPSTLFEHPSLQQLELSHNNFSFLQVPGTMGYTSKLIAIDLSFNDLRGLLPAFLGSMPKLSALSLEFNKLTGMIPTQYALKAVVPPAPDRSSLQRLLLGGNYLVGPIPGPLMGLKPGYSNVSLVDNCLYKCPGSLFFCQGGDQKSSFVCKKFRH